MTTYEESGVNIEEGDKASRIAYEAAKKTFASRSGKVGEPVVQDGGFTGMMDFGDFYLVQNNDGVGSKMLIAEALNKFDTLAYDLVAMVADDAICSGAETVSITNTIDTQKVNSDQIAQMMEGLEKVCTEQKIVIPGGEIGEMPDQVNGTMWNSTAVGIVTKDKVLPRQDIQSGDKIIAIKSRGFRSNGFSLIRKILSDNFGDNYVNEPYTGHPDASTWGEAVLTPCLVYSRFGLDLIGGYKEPAKADIKAFIHITGGGIYNNLDRILKPLNLSATLDNLPQPHQMMLDLMKLGNVSNEEAYKVWNMGVGMLIISNEFEKIKVIAEQHGMEVAEVGQIT